MGNIVIGVVGAVVGGWLLSGVLGVYVGGGLIGPLIVAPLGAIVLLFVVGLIEKA